MFRLPPEGEGVLRRAFRYVLTAVACAGAAAHGRASAPGDEAGFEGVRQVRVLRHDADAKPELAAGAARDAAGEEYRAAVAVRVGAQGRGPRVGDLAHRVED